MKSGKYTCAACGHETRYARPVCGSIICNWCNDRLIMYEKLELSNGSKITIQTK